MHQFKFWVGEATAAAGSLWIQPARGLQFCLEMKGPTQLKCFLQACLRFVDHERLVLFMPSLNQAECWAYRKWKWYSLSWFWFFVTRVPDYNQSIQCGINLFLFLDIINIPRIVLFAREILNFTQSSLYYCSWKGRIFCKRVSCTSSKGVYLLRLQKGLFMKWSLGWFYETHVVSHRETLVNSF